MTVRDIFDFLNQKFPTDTAAHFDNVGILIGDPDSEVKKTVISLDCTTDAIKLAKEQSAELIITHHPVIFDPLKTVLEGSLPYELIKSGISVISMHTNLDIGIGGVNDSLCEALSFTDHTKYLAEDGFILNSVNLPYTISADNLAKHIKEKLNCAVKYVAAERPIKKVLVCSGSGGSYLNEAANHGFDALITADVKHNIFIDASNLGITVFDAGHFDTENVVITPLKELLRNNFKDIVFLENLFTAIKSI